jgi:ATP-binding cassette subfamily F protein uup
VTHDRAFLDRVATRILELDRGRIRSYPGNFSDYERTKAGELAAEATAQRRVDRFRAQEEAWIRQGIEARRTRNEGRVKRLERLRAERVARRERLNTVTLTIGAGQRSGKLVAELTRVSKSFSGRPIVKNLELLIDRGDRIGLIGPNGSGKTTLSTSPSRSRPTPAARSAPTCAPPSSTAARSAGPREDRRRDVAGSSTGRAER